MEADGLVTVMVGADRLPKMTTEVPTETDVDSVPGNVHVPLMQANSGEGSVARSHCWIAGGMTEVTAPHVRKESVGLGM